MTERVDVAGLRVDPELHAFIEERVLPGLSLDAPRIWAGLARLVAETGPRIAAALAERERIQAAIDAWHHDHAGAPPDPAEYRAFLEQIGYLLPVGGDFSIDTDRIDPEIASVAGPQLVVPITNARYSLNAANARWGSLYDAVYGTDVLGSPPPPGPYDPARGAQVVAWVRRFLDQSFPLADGASHAEASAYRVHDGALEVQVGDSVSESRSGGPPKSATWPTWVPLAGPETFTGWRGSPEAPAEILLTHHGLGVVLHFDRDSQVGAADAAGISDVELESAVTTIIDFEDSIAAVDAADKVTAYANWLGLMRGDLSASVSKGDERFERRLAENRSFSAPDGAELIRRGRSLLLVRNVGHLMTSPAVLDADGAEISECLLDALFTVLCALHDFTRPLSERNSPAGSVYVVKPKLHGPEEVTLAVDIFAIVESVLGLAPNTIKLGVMDEERRTTVNLKECIRAARERIAFINTGFLDRTGDEIHTSMEAGAMVPKAEMRSTRWIGAYEDFNVDTGLACGLAGRAQIGKGMWAAPDNMAEMLEAKLAHPRAGASTAWVPSPTAATLHASHYHQVDVAARQAELAAAGPRAGLEDLLAIPLAPDTDWDEATRLAEVDNNAQGILGYVVRWVDQGIGCSKVPDIHDVALMEDRATCRISSQHIANWLRHGVVGAEQVEARLRAMAARVDEQNAGDPVYVPMAPGFDGEAFTAARELIFSGTAQPSGYTEPILHRRRAAQKRSGDPVDAAGSAIPESRERIDPR